MGDRRPHRGRGDQRPCDVCRKRKARCVVRDHGACEQCKKIRKACTFNDPPRQHTPKKAQPQDIHSVAAKSHARSFPWGESDAAFFNLEEPLSMSPNMHDLDLGLSLGLELDLSTPQIQPTSVESPQNRPADERLQRDAFLLGPSSDPDPFFRSRYNFNSNGYHQATIRGYQHASQGNVDLLFAITPRYKPTGMANVIVNAVDEPILATLDPFTPRLFQLFYKFVHPVFPLPVVHQEGKSLSTLGAAVCATALPWRSHDASLPWAPFETTENTTEETPPDVNLLYKYVWNGISREMHAPSFETIQSALLLIERRVPLTELSDSPFNSCLMASITSMAFSLGLNRNAEDWDFISDEQKSERRMLWWLIFIEDKWVSAAAGKPCTIRPDDYDIPEPTMTFSGSPAEVHFEHLLSLTFILRDMLASVMNWKFWSHQTQTTEEIIATVKGFQDRLAVWRSSLGQGLHLMSNAGDSEAMPFGVLIVAYLYCLLLLYKTWLRATEGTPYFANAIQSALTFSSNLCIELSNLGLDEFTTFWFSWSNSQFNAFSEFFPYLIAIAPTEEDRIAAEEATARLRQWLFSHGKYIDLVRVAMSRLAACQTAINSGQVRISAGTGLQGLQDLF